MSRSTSPSDKEAKAAERRFRNSRGAPREEEEEEEEEESEEATSFLFLALAREASNDAVAANRTASTRPFNSSSFWANSAR